MKPLVIFHANCTDGYGAAFAAWMKLGGTAIYIPFKYGEETIPDAAGRDVYILDFSFPREVMDYIVAEAKRVVWLDHHKTAFEMWCGEAPNLFFTQHKESNERLHIVLDDCKSGALLAWEFFHPGTEVPMLIRHIDDRDRWVFALEGSRELHAALQSMKPWSFEQWKREFLPIGMGRPGLSFEATARYSELMKIGEALLRAQDIMIKQQANLARKCSIVYERQLGEDIDGYLWIGLALNTQNHISETGHVLANLSGTYGLLWYVGQDGKVKCSLRSTGDYDVSAIAKVFGGGGHRNAAGFETDIDTLMGWLA